MSARREVAEVFSGTGEEAAGEAPDVFLPGEEERSQQAGSQTEPEFVPMHPVRAAGYFSASVLLGLSQGFGQSVISSNLAQLQGSFGATQAETLWLTAAYMAPNVSLTLVLIKIRNQFGLRKFAEFSIVGFLLAALLNYAAGDLQSAIAVRFMGGAAAAPLTSLAFLYMLEPLPPEKKMNFGLCAALTFIFMGPSFTGLVSPYLLGVGLWHGLTALEAAFALLGFGLVYLLPLGSPRHPMKVHADDITSYIFVAVGMGSITVALIFGPTYWWVDASWIGYLLAVGIASSFIAIAIELNRKAPLLDIRWIMSPAILQFAGALLVFRLVLSEQTAGATGLFRELGLLNDQLAGLYLVIIASTIGGGLICAATLKPGRERTFHVVALVLLITGALMDSNSTDQTVPSDMYLSQAMISLASALFMPPAMLSGLTSALAKGYDYILSFVIVFLTTQKVGGILGSSLFSTFVVFRRQFHSVRLSEQITSATPQQLPGLESQVRIDATVMAYNDAFMVIAVVSGLALVALIIHMSADRVRNSRRLTPSSV
ncbi:MFS transporter [Hyphomonas sp. ND6WE1B]|uniref:MFS transporter n=1 Tax=Hyphomonas sp. ND6WE1B TaxID=1848191 RepID=UPI000AB1D870|nr:MFS transporter [Hyphomonas sp. ND6WE1B]